MVMNWNIVAYAYEGAVHCCDCTEERFGVEPYEGYTVKDSEGNTPKPVFVSDIRQGDICDTCKCFLCGKGLEYKPHYC